MAAARSRSARTTRGVREPGMQVEHDARDARLAGRAARSMAGQRARGRPRRRSSRASPSIRARARPGSASPTRARARRSSWVTTHTMGTPACGGGAKVADEGVAHVDQCLRRYAQDFLEARHALGELLDGGLAQSHQAIVAGLLRDLLRARLGHDELADLVVDLEDSRRRRCARGGPSSGTARTPPRTPPSSSRALPLRPQLVDVQAEERHLIGGQERLDAARWAHGPHEALRDRRRRASTRGRTGRRRARAGA